MYCTNCGFKNQVGDKYCRKCGTALSKLNTEIKIKKRDSKLTWPKIVLIIFLVAVLLCVFFTFIILYSMAVFGRPFATMALVMMVVACLTMVFVTLGIIFKDTKKQFMLINFNTALLPLTLTLLVLMYYIAFFDSEMEPFRHAFFISMITVGVLTCIAFVVNGAVGFKKFENKPEPFKITHLILSVLSSVTFITALSAALVRNNPSEQKIITAVIFAAIFVFLTYAIGVATSFFIDRKAK